MIKLTKIARAVKEALRYWPAPPPVPAAYPGDTARYVSKYVAKGAGRG